ncbi:MAG: hypothetical protein QXS20_03385 [Candidatus Thorarchaeota archaeon]
MADRPLGVTILAILELLGGLFAILTTAGVLMVALMVDPVLLVLAILPLIVGIVNLILFYGFWTLKGWAWILGIIFGIIGIILAIFPIQPISLIINLIIVVYLLTPGVRAAFGK